MAQTAPNSSPSLTPPESVRRASTFAAELEQDKQARSRAKSVKPLRRIMPFVLNYPGTIALFLIFMVLAAMLSLSIGWAMKLIVDCGFGGSGELPAECERFALGNAANMGSYFKLGIAVAFFTAVFSALRFYYVSVLGQRVIADLRKAVYNHLTTLSTSFFERVHTGEVQSRLTTDTMLIETVIGSSISFALRTIVTSIGALVLMFFISWKLTLMVISIGPFLILIGIVFGRRVQRLSRSSQDNLATASVRAGESLGAIQTVQAFTREVKEREDFGRATEATFDAHRSRILVRSVMTFVLFGFGMAGMVGVFWYGAELVQTGDLSGGDIVGFSYYAFAAVSGVGFLTNTYTDFLRAAGATERIMELLSETSDIIAPEKPEVIGVARGEIRFDDVSFSYPTRPEQQALHGVGFDIKPGETIALVGPSGAGKTTVFQLLLRFYDVNSGAVKIDGHDVRALAPENLRRQFSIVQQNTPLFSGTAMENIRYGRDGASDDDVIAAAKSAFAHDFISALPQGYNTDLGEAAASLSGGQRQRIAIARAILRDAPVLLLDEATSALDSESEIAVQSAFENLSKSKTTLVIAHRLSTVRKADRIIVLDQGRIVETGTHDSLAKTGGLYARLSEMQFGIQ
ncbi:ABC transporter transmembrane domain-containing protein [Robiginitomaculum antarcticum]|uniref:ABC transporter transmembrane domain-containing protein n=1 Tax=Robiginitomaculum antarcticum TaxID=437507 RepID=UPI001EFF3681|nr:ABC transporter transmembrane domain-containing protein [Robiginitomaculum antarcticum]